MERRLVAFPHISFELRKHALILGDDVIEPARNLWDASESYHVEISSWEMQAKASPDFDEGLPLGASTSINGADGGVRDQGMVRCVRSGTRV